MARLRARIAVLLTLLLAVAAAAGVAVGAEATLEQLGRGALSPSVQPGLLAPISEVGRTGWDCMPEKAAGSKTAHGAGLPGDP
ncbi:MAG: hypothetical protein NVSMB64_05830 [Candidatus Velthaea sp.]